MELFGIIGWISVPQLVLQYIDLPAETIRGLVENELLFWWITLGVGGGLFLLGLIFGGFGLMRLCKRAGIKHGWLGFFPFANTYITGKLAGEASMFGARVKRIGLWSMICEIVFVAVNIFAIVLQMVVLDINLFERVGDGVYGLSEAAMQEAGMGWIYTLLNYHILEIITYVFSLVILFLFYALFYAFYRKYYARSPVMMTFLSAVLPGRGFALFAVRNNTPIDYNAYMQQRMQQQQQAYGGYYGPQTPPPQPPQPGPSAPEEPFGDEFGGTPPAGGSTPPGDDPFSDF